MADITGSVRDDTEVFVTKGKKPRKVVIVQRKDHLNEIFLQIQLKYPCYAVQSALAMLGIVIVL